MLAPQNTPAPLPIRNAARRQVKCHHPPLHNLLRLANIAPDDVETISAVRRSPGYRTSFTSFICNSKEQALAKAEVIEYTHPVQVYCDGSGFEGGIGAAAVL